MTADFGNVDIVVNNAAILAAKPFEETSEADFDAMFATNVKGPFFLVQRLLPILRDGGRFINVSSGSTTTHVPNTAIYAASKGALEQFTRLWAKELASKSICVNSILPGFTDTDWMKELPEEHRAAIAAQTSLNRLGTAKDIARVVLFLASELGGWVTGQQIRADGGL